jgi:hypothetical protein
MNWFTWRQHRKQFLIFAALLALLAAVLIPTGIHYWNTYQQALITCKQNPLTPVCSDLADNLFSGSMDGFIRVGVVLASFGVPLLLGLFIGSPLVAREYEEGTNKLAWTQSVSRRKWLTTKLLWALGFALLYGVILAVLVTWWSRTLNDLTDNRFVQGHFETQGLMPAVYSVFFTAIGFVTGAWFRKTLISFAVTFGVFVLCMAGFAQWVRPHYMAPTTVTASMAPGAIERKIPANVWLLRRYIQDKNGKVTNDISPRNLPPECQQFTRNIQVSDDSHIAKVKMAGGDPLDDCLNHAGYRQAAQYQPTYRYWDFQRIEAGIYLGMTALAVGITYGLVLRRDA